MTDTRNKLDKVIDDCNHYRRLIERALQEHDIPACPGSCNAMLNMALFMLLKHESKELVISILEEAITNIKNDTQIYRSTDVN